MARNNIKRIVGLDEIGQSLEQLWISYNQIEKLEGLSPCIKLNTLYISNNRIKIWDEIGKLNSLPEMKSILLVGNPIYGDMEYEQVAPLVVKRLPQIEQVDSKMVSASIRKAAEEMD